MVVAKAVARAVDLGNLLCRACVLYIVKLSLQLYSSHFGSSVCVVKLIAVAIVRYM